MATKKIAVKSTSAKEAPTKAATAKAATKTISAPVAKMTKTQTVQALSEKLGYESKQIRHVADVKYETRRCHLKNPAGVEVPASLPRNVVREWRIACYKTSGLGGR